MSDTDIQQPEHIKNEPNSNMYSTQFSIPPNIQTDQIKEALNNVDISTMLNKIANNPEEVSKIMANTQSAMTPDMMEQARKLAAGSQGDKLKKELNKRHMDPRQIRLEFKEQQKIYRKTAIQAQGPTKKVCYLKQTRKLIQRDLPISSIQSSAASMLKYKDVVEISCSRLALGPLKGKTIKIWYNPDIKGNNRRATKIVGFPIGGEILIVMEEGDLLIKNVETAEQFLN